MDMVVLVVQRPLRAVAQAQAQQGQLQQARIGAGPVALDTALVADLRLDGVPLVGLLVIQQGAQVFESEGRAHIGRVKQRAQPAVVVGPAVGIHRLPGQLCIDGARHLGHGHTALHQQGAGDVVGGLGLGIPVRPMRLRSNQRAIGVPIGQHKTDLDRVTIAAKTRRFHIQHRGGGVCKRDVAHGAFLRPAGAATMGIFPLNPCPMSSSLLALIDDIATILDDVALLSKVAAQKTAGVLGDDLALNAQQVAGVSADRELPVVWAVCKGSLVNKVILVPAALLISIFIPWAVTPLLMVGGAYLCFEGFEKLAHKFLHSQAQEQAHADELLQALANPAVDLVALERDKIKGAIRTDFVLSAEIIAITLGTVQNSPWLTQLAVLCGIAVAMTFGVYGFVAAIVKIDDAGLYLSRRTGPAVWLGAQQSLGRALLGAAPWLMKTLAVVGTAAMFLVGGGILVHGLGPLRHAVQALLVQWGGGGLEYLVQAVLPLVMDALTGVVAGALVFLGMTALQRARQRLQ